MLSYCFLILIPLGIIVLEAVVSFYCALTDLPFIIKLMSLTQCFITLEVGTTIFP
jgi:hypothetical protein